ncbi:MAG: ABC transporter permease subunit [Acidimicrobiaceae bacterium]|nr:ABC transporter permease subunit [Acidimicrobiia bacterium]MCY4493142.1 ABC transporter permease subunit [Acidimicrobiaceae bacterium]
MNLLAENFWDNSNLSEWEIPFGLWIEEIVFWLTTNIGGLLDAIKWPVDQMLKLVIDNLLQDWLPWPVVLLMFLLLGASTRNFKVGLGSAVALLVCGLLGNEFWDLTMETVGMIIVAVIICAVFGIPLGVLSARVDAFWNRLRPILDGMQVIHPFVYLLPIIFLFGVRRTPGVLATLVFALPPIVRLTNLGVRQVPADVVEAARAFGATESRVLREVQLPLARPAIMAGLNQTLLLSLSMVGIVAIIAGGGLGKPILTALATADIPLGASAGAGLYFVGVLLDRISQPEATDKRLNLFSRMRGAWSTRSDPVVPPMPDPASGADSGFVTTGEAPVTLTPAHRLAAGVSVVAGLVAAVSALLPWGEGSGRISSHVRFDDLLLPGSHTGLDATGGSYFGVLVAVLGISVAACGLAALLSPRARKSAFVAVPTFLACGLGIVSLAVAYLTIRVRSDAYSNGTGVWLALAAGAAITVLALRAALSAEFEDKPARIGWRDVLGVAVLSAFLVFAGASGSWILDQRSDSAQIARELAADSGGADQGGVAAEILAEAMANTRRVTVQGLDADGPQIGYIIIALTVLGAAAALAARAVRSAKAQRFAAGCSYAIGCGITVVAVAWIASLVRLDTLQISPGASAFLTACGGLVLAAQGWRSLSPD